MKTIRVKAVAGGWSLENDLDIWAPAFLSGAAAERQAMGLAAALARVGQTTRVVIEDRTGAVVGTNGPQLRLV